MYTLCITTNSATTDNMHFYNSIPNFQVRTYLVLLLSVSTGTSTDTDTHGSTQHCAVSKLTIISSAMATYLV